MNRLHKKRIWSALLAFCGLALAAACTRAPQQRAACGVLDEPVVCQMPREIRQALEATQKVHPFEILDDEAHSVCVLGIGELDEGRSTEGYGIMVQRNATSTLFPDIRHSRQPQARYDTQDSTLWYASCVMEGTGVHAEQLYHIAFCAANDSARIAGTIEPYRMQQALLEHLRYTLGGEQITFYADGEEIAQARISTADMGPTDTEEPVWIGEQISYDLSQDRLRVCFVPGIRFASGPVLFYDDMPTLSADITLAGDGSFTLSAFALTI